MLCRIHRFSPTQIDVDFNVAPYMIITRVCEDHVTAAEAKRQFDALTEAEQRAYLLDMVKQALK